jgi:hypothetical protein
MATFGMTSSYVVAGSVVTAHRGWTSSLAGRSDGSPSVQEAVMAFSRPHVQAVRNEHPATPDATGPMPEAFPLRAGGLPSRTEGRRTALATESTCSVLITGELAEDVVVQGKGAITDERVAVGGAFDSDTATGMIPGCAPRRRRANVPAIVINRQEVSPMNAVSAVGAPLPSTIARLR